MSLSCWWEMTEQGRENIDAKCPAEPKVISHVHSSFLSSVSLLTAASRTRIPTTSGLRLGPLSLSCTRLLCGYDFEELHETNRRDDPRSSASLR